MSPADDRPDPPWSPYPVQDWSTLPEDLVAARTVDPSWPPPQAPHRRRWVPVAVLTAIGVLLAGTSYAGLAGGVAAGDHAALDYLPADGSATYSRVETTRELRTTVVTEVTESALLSGVAGLLSTDSTFGIRTMDELFDERDTLRVWRTTSTLVDDPVATPQTTRLYRVNAGVELVGRSTPTEGFAYVPALVELPAEVVPGQSWSSAGSAGDELDYRSDLRSTAAPDGCLQVDGTLRYLTKAGARSRILGVSRTWCPGRGLVAASESSADLRTVATRTDRPAPRATPTTDTPIRWRDPRSWTPQSLDTVSINPVFGEGPMNGATASAITPVRTASGLVVRALSAPGDLVATTPKTLQTWTSTWRAHPGGAIMTLTAFGNVVVVTTSERQLVGYSDTGVRLWQFALDELAPTAPVRVSETHAVLVDLSGDVRRFDLVTGLVDWTRNVGSDVSVAPAAGSGLVVVADRSYLVTALDAVTGDERWTEPLDVKGLAVVGDLVVAVQDQTAHALEVDSGRHRWLRHYDGTFTRLLAFGGSTVLAAKSGSILIDHQGVVTADLAGYLELTAAADTVLGWGPDRAEVFDSAGRLITGFDIAAVNVVSSARPGLAIPEGVLLFDLDWTFGAWTDA